MAKKKDEPKATATGVDSTKEINFKTLTHVEEGNKENAIKELEAALDFLDKGGDKETQLILNKILKMIKDK
jgi:hypothetical protein